MNVDGDIDDVSDKKGQVGKVWMSKKITKISKERSEGGKECQGLRDREREIGGWWIKSGQRGLESVEVW